VTLAADGADRSVKGRPSGLRSVVLTNGIDLQRLFVAAAGSLFNPGGDRGVYRSLRATR